MTIIVSSHRARSTGTQIAVIDNRDGSFDVNDLPWFTLCEDHGGVCSHPTRKLAEDWAAEPETWCQECQAATIAPPLPGRVTRTGTYCTETGAETGTVVHSSEAPPKGWTREGLPEHSYYGAG